MSQGLDVNDLGIVQELKESFRNKKFDSFTCFVAFANTAGLKQIKYDLFQATKHVKKWAVVVGIDFTTSKEALEILLELEVNTKVFFTKTPNKTFHPKIFLFEGVKQNKLIVGSSNYTKGGLLTNIESSLCVEFDTTREPTARGGHDYGGEKLVKEVKEYFAGLLDCTHPNIKKLDDDLIKFLVNKKIVLTENRINKARKRSRQKSTTKEDTEISKLFPSLVTKEQKSTTKQINAFKEEIKKSKKQQFQKTADYWSKKKYQKDLPNYHEGHCWKFPRKGANKIENIPFYMKKLKRFWKDNPTATKLNWKWFEREYPQAAKEGARSLEPLKHEGLIDKDYKITDAGKSLINKKFVAKQLEKWCYGNDFVNRGTAKWKEGFTLFPILFVYQILEKLTAAERYITKDEFENFVVFARNYEDVGKIVKIIKKYRKEIDRMQKIIISELPETDPRIWREKGEDVDWEDLEWGSEKITVKKDQLASIKKKVKKITSLPNEWTNKEEYYKMLHSKDDILQYRP